MIDYNEADYAVAHKTSEWLDLNNKPYSDEKVDDAFKAFFASRPFDIKVETNLPHSAVPLAIRFRSLCWNTLSSKVIAAELDRVEFVAPVDADIEFTARIDFVAPSRDEEDDFDLGSKTVSIRRVVRFEVGVSATREFDRFGKPDLLTVEVLAGALTAMFDEVDPPRYDPA